jgi:hypothetical protein
VGGDYAGIEEEADDVYEYLSREMCVCIFQARKEII